MRINREITEKLDRILSRRAHRISLIFAAARREKLAAQRPHGGVIVAAGGAGVFLKASQNGFINRGVSVRRRANGRRAGGLIGGHRRGSPAEAQPRQKLRRKTADFAADLADTRNPTYGRTIYTAPAFPRVRATRLAHESHVVRRDIDAINKILPSPELTIG